MDPVISEAVAEAAVAGMAKVSGLSGGMLARRRRARIIRRSMEGLAERQANAGDDVVSRLDAEYIARVVSYVRSAEFEQLAIQLTGMALEDRCPEEYINDLRETLLRSLCLRESLPTDAAELLADRLFDELWGAVAQCIGESRRSSGAHELPGLAVSVSMRAAAAARNCRLLRRLEALTEFVDFAEILRAQVRKVEGQIRLPHAEGGRRLPLSRLYIEAHIARNVADLPVGPAEKLTAAELLATNMRAVILGDPGGGKSTLAAWIACNTVARHRERQIIRVPFLVVMRQYAQWFEREQMSIARYLPVMIGGRYQIEPPPDCVEYFLLNGHAMVILDGMDELLDTALRRRVSEAIEAFAHAYPTTQILVTSRRVGYSQAPLDSTLFPAFQLDDFSPGQVAEYATKWFALDASLPQSERQELSDAFLSESQSVEELRHNPLMLALLCALYRGEGYIPRNRLDVYERCSVLLFEGWDRQRGIQVPLPFKQHARPAICHLALWMYANPTRQAGVTERELIKSITSFLSRKRFDDQDEAEAAARAFATYCRYRAWVLTEIGTTGDGEPLFAFTHRTFLEFFAASQLVRTNSTPEDLYTRLEPHIRAQEWDVVAQMAVLLLERYVDAAADAFMQLTLRDAETSQSAEERVALLSFTTRLLSSQIPSPPVLRDVFNACWALACSPGQDSQASPTAAEAPHVRHPAALMLRAHPEAWPVIARMIREHSATDPPIGVSPLLAATLDQLVCHVDHRLGFPHQLRSFWHSESLRNAERLRPVFTARADQDRWAAVEAVFGEMWSIEQLVAIHGPQAVCEETPVWATYRRAPILLQAVLAGHHFTWASNDQDDRLLPYIWVDPAAPKLSEQLSHVLPFAPPPWARLSRAVFWDMSIGEPADTASAGSPAFDLVALCACLTYEARFLARAHGFGEPETLPNWLRTPPGHPLTLLVTHAARMRYEGLNRSMGLSQESVSAPVATVIERWATSQVDLVMNDLDKMRPGEFFKEY